MSGTRTAEPGNEFSGQWAYYGCLLLFGAKIG